MSTVKEATSQLRTAVDTVVRHMQEQARTIDQLAAALDFYAQRTEQPPEFPAHLLPALGFARDRAAMVRNAAPLEVPAAVVTFPRPSTGPASGGHPAG